MHKFKVKYLLVIAAFCIFVWLIIASGLTINTTPSMEIGLYIKQQGEIKRGDVVLVCLVDPYKTIGLQQIISQRVANAPEQSR